MLTWLKKLRRRPRSNAAEPTRSAPPPPPPPVAKTPPPPPARTSPPPPPPVGEPERGELNDETKVALIMRDGTSLSPPDDPESEQRFQYLAQNLIPGAGRSGENDAEND